MRCIKSTKFGGGFSRHQDFVEHGTFLGDVTETKWQNGLKCAWLLTRFMNGVWLLDLDIRQGSSYRCRGMEVFTLLTPLGLDLSTRVVYEATITYHEGKDIHSLTFCIF